MSSVPSTPVHVISTSATFTINNTDASAPTSMVYSKECTVIFIIKWTKKNKICPILLSIYTLKLEMLGNN